MKKRVLMLAATTALLSFPIIGSVSNVEISETVSAATTVHKYKVDKSVKDIKKSPYHSKDNHGNIYKASFSDNNKNVKLTKKYDLFDYRTTWNVTKKMTVKVNGKTRTYYYVKSDDKKVSGWTWSGYLYKGQFKSAD